jgi:SgrR family transcriptional regulator
MSSPRLRSQFETLFEHFNGQNTDIQLEEVTDILFCTRRNARIVLNKMEEEGWVEWHPAAGRGKQSRLIFNQSRSEVSEALARRYVEEGKIGQALSVLDNDADKLTQVIQSYLGVKHQEGLQVIRLPYYRPLSMLNPRKNMRRSEQHIARQVFSGLTKLDEDDQLQPDLAHSWQALNNQHWRFYLRPGVRFHNGEPLSTEHVLQSLMSLKGLTLFSHIESVTSPADLVIDILLNQPDVYFPILLSECCAKILLPESQRSDNFDLIPIGTGPYKIIVNDNKRLQLQAFDAYFGFRPLIDHVEVWVIDEAHSSLVFPHLPNPIKRQNHFTKDDVGLDPGCTYLLLNRHNGIARDERWARYLSYKLSSLSVFKELPETKVVELGVLPAHGLKPGWYHHSPQPELAPEGLKTLTISYHAQHPMFPSLAKTLQKLLGSDGIDVEFIKYDHSIEVSETVDIWIQAMGLANRREAALAGWLLNYSEIEAASRDEDFAHWRALIEAWRRSHHLQFPAKELGRSLVEQNQLIPLFHSWLGISKDQCGSLQNAKCNALGWFDFSQVWVKPDFINQ